VGFLSRFRQFLGGFTLKTQRFFDIYTGIRTLPRGAFIFQNCIKFSVLGPTPTHPCTKVGEIWLVGVLLRNIFHPISATYLPYRANT